MTDAVLTKTRIRAGVWEGVLTGAGTAPRIEVLHLGQPVPGLIVTPLPERAGDHAVRLPIPAGLLSDGVQTFTLRCTGTGAPAERSTTLTVRPVVPPPPQDG